MHTRNFPIVLLIAFALQSCGGTPFWLPKAHKIEIQQGNLIDEEQLNAIEVGVSRSVVLRILGAPVLQTNFDNNRWDYVYAKGPAGEEKRFGSLVIYFKEDVVSRIDNDYKS